MEKTITIRIAELREMLANVINQSQLPASVVRMVFIEYVGLLTDASTQQLQDEMRVYQEAEKQKDDKKEKAASK